VSGIFFFNICVICCYPRSDGGSELKYFIFKQNKLEFSMMQELPPAS